MHSLNGYILWSKIVTLSTAGRDGSHCKFFLSWWSMFKGSLQPKQKAQSSLSTYREHSRQLCQNTKMQRTMFPVWNGGVFTHTPHSLQWTDHRFLAPFNTVAGNVCIVSRIIAKKGRPTFSIDKFFLYLWVQVKKPWIRTGAWGD